MRKIVYALSFCLNYFVRVIELTGNIRRAAAMNKLVQKDIQILKLFLVETAVFLWDSEDGYAGCRWHFETWGHY